MKTLNPKLTFALNAVAFIALGVLFTLPWLFTNEEIIANVSAFWFGGAK